MSRGRDSKKNCLKEVRDCLLSSKELVKVLCRVGGLGKRTSPTLSLVLALCAELDCAFVRVEGLMKEEWSKRGEVEEFLMKRFAEDKARWRFKERERVRNMERRMAEEVEAERRLRRQTERLSQKLGEEMAGMKAGLYRMSKKLQSERRTKEILQQVCDELSRGIGEDRAQVEELKRESEKVLEEDEKEREMLQLAGVLREERVQMKLSEAKYHFEEENAVVEKLKEELEVYMSSKENKDADDDGDGGSSKLEKIEELWACFKTHDPEVKNVEVEENGSDEGDDDSADSDLQSIELNMDNTTRSYRWSFIEEFNHDDVADEPRRSSVDRMFKGRKSLSDKIIWESISLNRGAPDNTINDGNPEPDPKSQGKPNGLKGRRLIDFFSQAQAMNDEEDPKMNDKPVNLTSKIALPAP
ncbi:hypothetical protein MLD38_004087 [Melastoma candidum]|uniref:Uncharacterized protein n=1 Tax=Melastoma candidum TaxID=119954 RepID=A0ACB9S4I0_9MYRT|nr:hypothetical protein MLD38_004087 [Melastoma candidum]